MASQSENAMNKNTDVSSGNSINQAPASVGVRGFDSVSGHGAQDGIHAVARTNTTNIVAPMSNVSEPVVNRKTNIRRLAKAARDAQIRLFLADIALLEYQTKTFGGEVEQSKLSDASIDAFEVGIDLFNVRMETSQVFESAT